MRVKEIMNERHPFIYEDELATKARAIIRDFTLRILPVVNENRRLLGVVSRGNIMTISSSVSPIRVKGIMATPRHVATMEDEVASTAKEMIRLDEWCVPVVGSAQDKTYKGVIGLENFIQVSLKTNPHKLSKQVSEVMSTNLLVCSPEDEVDNVWRLMQTKAFAGLPVVKNKKLVGIITQKDLLERRAILPTFESTKGRFRASSKISSIMKTSVIAVKPYTRVGEAAELMISRDIGRIPVKDDKGKLVGVIDREDIARLLV
ncbi:CBS domain-containing protein [Candidatus Bathyarchaeota archaeon]|nr:CBS domain-containing protein [Candidatus Bathyarchaeota archaeon]